MILWLDIETTGLNERYGSLLEVAFVFTDDNICETDSISLIIKPWMRLSPVDWMTPMSYHEWKQTLDPIILDMHGKNGLLDEIESLDSKRKISVVQDEILSWLIRHMAEPEPFVLGGSAIGFDCRWLFWHMPELRKLFSHRSIDVSSITELARRWSPEVYKGRPKSGEAHRALADVRESIAYLKYYRECGFIGNQNVVDGIG